MGPERLFLQSLPFDVTTVCFKSLLHPTITHVTFDMTPHKQYVFHLEVCQIFDIDPLDLSSSQTRLKPPPTHSPTPHCSKKLGPKSFGSRHQWKHFKNWQGLMQSHQQIWFLIASYSAPIKPDSLRLKNLKSSPPSHAHHSFSMCLFSQNLILVRMNVLNLTFV